MYQTKDLEKLETQISYLKTFFLENCDVDGPQMTIWRTRIVLLIPKAKNTHSEM
jgi:hypothetical protein